MMVLRQRLHSTKNFDKGFHTDTHARTHDARMHARTLLMWSEQMVARSCTAVLALPSAGIALIINNIADVTVVAGDDVDAAGEDIVCWPGKRDAMFGI